MSALAVAPRWLVRLRWVAVGAEALAIGVAAFALGLELPLGTLFALVGLHALSNLVLAARRDRLDEAGWGGALLFDVWLLTALLAQSGGPTNPFSVLYFVQVVLAAVLLGYGWTFALWLNAVSGYGTLFFFHHPVPGLGHDAHGHGGFQLHLYGMAIAFAVAAGFLAFFVARLSAAFREREAALTASRARAEKAQRVASLTTLAAGAAHELATPLGTIAVVAGELARELEGAGEARAGLAEDARVIRSEVDRCRRILDSMSADAGDVLGESPETVPFAELAEEVRADLAEARRGRLRVGGAGVMRVPRRAARQAIESLVQNAFDAAPEGEVELRLEGAEVVVRDRGAGMDAETLERVGEPFFTTKAPGRGMGLGLFLARATAEALGGGLELSSAPGEGTTARWRVDPARVEDAGADEERA